MQLPENHPAARQLGETILSALGQNPLFVSAALPARVFLRCSTVIRAVNLSAPMWTMQSARSAEADTEFVLIYPQLCSFPSPDDYDGGELIVEDTYGLHHVKLPAGHMILYPSTSLHHVTPVTRGTRLSLFSGSKAWCATTASAPYCSTSTLPSSALTQPSRRLCPGTTHRRLPQPAATLGGNLSRVTPQ